MGLLKFYLYVYVKVITTVLLFLMFVTWESELAFSLGSQANTFAVILAVVVEITFAIVNIALLDHIWRKHR